MSVPAFRNSKSRVRRRRAHHALKRAGVAACPKCQAPTLPHRACTSCGYYNGRQVLGSAPAPEAKPKKKAEAKKEAPAKEEAKEEKKTKSAK